GRVDMLVDVVFLAQPLCGTRVHRHCGECTLPVLERTDPAFGGGVAAQRLPPGGYAPTKDCTNAIEQVSVHLSPSPTTSRPAGPQTGKARLPRRPPLPRVLDASEAVATPPLLLSRNRGRQYVQAAHRPWPPHQLAAAWDGQQPGRLSVRRHNDGAHH